MPLAACLFGVQHAACVVLLLLCVCWCFIYKLHGRLDHNPCTVRFESVAKVLANCKLQNLRVIRLMSHAHVDAACH